jgi:hypothetical protein
MTNPSPIIDHPYPSGVLQVDGAIIGDRDMWGRTSVATARIVSAVV